MNTYPSLWTILQTQGIFYKEKPFATFQNSILEFTELQQKVYAVAGYLDKITNHSVVAVYLENPFDALVGLIGTLVSGK